MVTQHSAPTRGVLFTRKGIGGLFLVEYSLKGISQNLYLHGSLYASKAHQRGEEVMRTDNTVNGLGDLHENLVSPCF